jgi:hypothetical protein
MAMALPVMSFASGATNSMRGAAFLSGIQDAMVVDVGGTSAGEGPAGGVRLFLRAIKKKGGVWPSLIASTCGL